MTAMSAFALRSRIMSGTIPFIAWLSTNLDWPPRLPRYRRPSRCTRSKRQRSIVPMWKRQ